YNDLHLAASFRESPRMSWRETIAAKIGPGTLGGITLGDWLRLLADNRFAVDLPYWPRAAIITWTAMFNSLCGCFERLRCDRAIQSTQPLPPIFILGIWRSGTTHLHNLLARDERLAFPSTFDALYPHICLT